MAPREDIILPGVVLDFDVISPETRKKIEVAVHKLFHKTYESAKKGADTIKNITKTVPAPLVAKVVNETVPTYIDMYPYRAVNVIGGLLLLYKGSYHLIRSFLLALKYAGHERVPGQLSYGEQIWRYMKMYWLVRLPKMVFGKTTWKKQVSFLKKQLMVDYLKSEEFKRNLPKRGVNTLWKPSKFIVPLVGGVMGAAAMNYFRQPLPDPHVTDYWKERLNNYFDNLWETDRIRYYEELDRFVEMHKQFNNN